MRVLFWCPIGVRKAQEAPMAAAMRNGFFFSVSRPFRIEPVHLKTLSASLSGFLFLLFRADSLLQPEAGGGKDRGERFRFRLDHKDIPFPENIVRIRRHHVDIPPHNTRAQGISLVKHCRYFSQPFACRRTLFRNADFAQIGPRLEA